MSTPDPEETERVLANSIEHWTPALVRKYNDAAHKYMTAMASALAARRLSESEIRRDQAEKDAVIADLRRRVNAGRSLALLGIFAADAIGEEDLVAERDRLIAEIRRDQAAKDASIARLFVLAKDAASAIAPCACGCEVGDLTPQSDYTTPSPETEQENMR